MKKRQSVSESSACEQGNSTTQGNLFNNSAEFPRFLGTVNPRHLRAVQRYLNTLAETLPIEGDGQSPQGWRWIKAPDVVSLVERAGGAA